MGNITTTTNLQEGPEYLLETTYGQLPATGSFTYIGPEAKVDFMADKKVIKVTNLGIRDLRNVLAGAREYGMKIEYTYTDSGWAKIGVNTGNEGNSYSIRTTPIMNAVAVYMDMLGTKHKSVTVNVKAGEKIRVLNELWSKQMPNVSTEGQGTHAAGTDPGTASQTFVNAGLTWGGTALDTREYNFTVGNMPERIHILGSGYIGQLPITGRKVSGDFTILNENATQLGDFETDTNRTLVFTHGLQTTTVTGADLEKIASLTLEPQKVVYERYSFTALTAVMS
jgi:hypothetical protein